MPVNHEIKSQLAKLLATEDLVVEHKKVETACFNVHTRVLTLPMWEKASNTVYDLLVLSRACRAAGLLHKDLRFMQQPKMVHYLNAQHPFADRPVKGKGCRRLRLSRMGCSKAACRCQVLP